jgi:polar amino acid transport system substrate-binding protein
MFISRADMWICHTPKHAARGKLVGLPCYESKSGLRPCAQTLYSEDVMYDFLSPWHRLALGVQLLLLCSLSACHQAEPKPPAAVDSSQVLYVVGSDADYAPFESLNAKQQVQGFDVDLLTAVAQHGGFRVAFVHTPWDRLFSMLASGERSILASSISITRERQQQMDFSEPYYLSRQMIAVAKGEEEIRSFHDLEGKRVAVQSGTTGDTLIQSLLGHDNPAIRRYVSMADALHVLEQGGADAVVGDSGLVTHYVETHRQSGVYAMQDTTRVAPEFYGFAVKKGNTRLLAQINAGLAAVKRDGSYDALVNKYFNGK